MSKRKENLNYTFTVEGNTEKWYLEWLQKEINGCEDSAYSVTLDSKVEPNPMSFAKRVNHWTTPSIVHLCDVEGSEANDVDRFHTVLSELKEAKKTKKIQYSLGYSNFTFELWMILHKQDCNRVLTHRKQYLDILNRAYGTSFLSLDKYKEKAEFEKCLSSLTLQDVRNAIRRSESLMAANESAGKAVTQYKGFTYYTDNPALTIWVPIKDILQKCRLIR